MKTIRQEDAIHVVGLKVLPAGERPVFEAEAGRPQSVVGVWQSVWVLADLTKAFIADAERYVADGA